MFLTRLRGSDNRPRKSFASPAGAHDDVVDAMAWGVRLCISREPPKSEPVKQPESWKTNLV